MFLYNPVVLGLFICKGVPTIMNDTVGTSLVDPFAGSHGEDRWRLIQRLDLGSAEGRQWIRV